MDRRAMLGATMGAALALVAPAAAFGEEEPVLRLPILILPDGSHLPWDGGEITSDTEDGLAVVGIYTPFRSGWHYQWEWVRRCDPYASELEILDRGDGPAANSRPGVGIVRAAGRDGSWIVRVPFEVRFKDGRRLISDFIGATS